MKPKTKRMLRRLTHCSTLLPKEVLVALEQELAEGEVPQDLTHQAHQYREFSLHQDPLNQRQEQGMGKALVQITMPCSKIPT
jgi:hypothetical protein